MTKKNRKVALAEALAARSEELFPELNKQDEPEEWEVRCVISAIHPKNEKRLIDEEDYNIPIKKICCKVGQPFKIFWENGGNMIHQVVTKAPDEDDYGFWIETTSKMWRFDYI